MGAEGPPWFSRALQKSGLRLGGVWQSWIVLVLPVTVAMGSQVSCFVAEFFFLFFVFELQETEASGLWLF